MNPKENGKKIIMKIRGLLVDMLVELDAEKYSSFVKESKGKKIIFLDYEKSTVRYVAVGIIILRKIP
jgi:hypothetical protein